MANKTWRQRLADLKTQFEDDFSEAAQAVDDHLLNAIRELGASVMGSGINSEEALGQLAMALECNDLLVNSALDIAEERQAGLPNHLIDPRSNDAIDLVLGTLKRCGFNKATQRAVVLAIASEMDGGGLERVGAEAAENTVTNGDVQRKTATETSEPENCRAARQNSERGDVGSADPMPEHIRIPDAQGKTATPSLSEGSHGHDDRNTRHSGARLDDDGRASMAVDTPAEQTPNDSDVQNLPDKEAQENSPANRQKARNTPEPAEVPFVPTSEKFAEFQEKERLKVSLISRGEVLVQEPFLEKALQGIEEILEMCPEIRQPFDGGNTMEESATKVYAALRSALRCGVRSIETTDDFDVTDLERAAQ